MLRMLRLILICMILPTFVGCAARPQQSVLRASENPSPIPVVIMEGDSSSLGSQHGTQLRSHIETLHAAYMDAIFQDATTRELALKNAMAYEPFINPEHLAEIRALSSASGMDYNNALLSQCFLDIIPMVACSTVSLPANASPDGVARMARNLDFMSMGVADKESLLLIFKPNDQYHFAAVSWPGLAGVITGMNEHGLTLASMEVTRLPAPARAMPYPLLYRTILERCKSVDEAIALLQTTPKQTANNLMLMDAMGNRAVVEILPPGVTVRRGRDNEALTSTNHQRGEDYATPARCWRYDRMRKSSQESFGRIDEPKLQKIIQSVSVPDFTLQSMVFEPANRIIYLSTGSSAGRGPFYRIDLGALMR